jgi:hypothetical protein
LFSLVWFNDPTRYFFFLALIFLTIISLIIQASTEWSTSIMSMNRRLSILYYNLNDLSKMIHYQHYLFALFIGFQEGYVFGSILKVKRNISDDSFFLLLKLHLV